MLEKKIEAAVKQYARDKGWLAYKFTSTAHIGVPDGIFISPKGEVSFFEFKQTGKKPTPMQLREHTKLRDKGCRVFVVDSVEQGKEIIDDLS